MVASENVRWAGRASGIAGRKDEHLDIVMAGTGAGRSGTGFDAIRFEHRALPDMALEEVRLDTPFLGRDLKAPFLISSMTGGPRRAAAINRNLAEAAQALGIAFAVGSQRVALETDGACGLTRDLRRIAPSVPILANLGAAQQVAGYGLDEARRVVDMIEADALIIHLNPLQEAVQPDGDRDWRGALAAIADLTHRLSVPVVVKEIGCGIGARTAADLYRAGVRIIDVAGAGGTSWAAVEAERARTAEDREVALAFADWGIPTALALQLTRQAAPGAILIASGGIRDGVDAAKAIRLGAHLVGQAAGTLAAALQSPDAVVRHFRVLARQLAIACFCTGSRTLADLRSARLVAGPGAP